MIMTETELEEFFDDMNTGLFVFVISVIMFGMHGDTFLTRLLYFLAWMFGWVTFTAIKMVWKSRKGTDAGQEN